MKLSDWSAYKKAMTKEFQSMIDNMVFQPVGLLERGAFLIAAILLGTFVITLNGVFFLIGLIFFAAIFFAQIRKFRFQRADLPL